MTWLMHTARGHGPCSRGTKPTTVHTGNNTGEKFSHPCTRAVNTGREHG